MSKWIKLVFGASVTREDSYSALNRVQICPQKGRPPPQTCGCGVLQQLLKSVLLEFMIPSAGASLFPISNSLNADYKISPVCCDSVMTKFGGTV